MNAPTMATQPVFTGDLGGAEAQPALVNGAQGRRPTGFDQAQFTPGPWHVHATIKPATGPSGVEIAAGMNSYGDGPASTVGRMFGFSDADKALAMNAPAMWEALQEIRRHPKGAIADPGYESCRQIAEAAIAKVAL